jgi:hypothetical protein
MKHVIAVVFFDKDGAAKPQTHGACNADGAKRFVRKVQ